MFISNYEKQYMNILKLIMQDGYMTDNRTAVRAKQLPQQIIQVDLSKEFPILKSKFVAFKTSVKEMLWIYQQQSNVVEDLRKQNCNVWNEWEGEDGTIGHAYGYIVKKYNQIDKLIESLKNNPNDRRMLINLWDNSELDKMNLQPCCFLTMWNVTDNKLNCTLIQRSGDMGLGVPFNTTQFAVLTHMLAQVTNHEVGTLLHVINNAHIYENHFEGIKKQMAVFDSMVFNSLIDGVNTNTNMVDVLNSVPKLKLNNDINNFYDFTINDIQLLDYKYMDKIKMNVVV